MCGIAGILNSELSADVVRRRLEKLTAALRDRGPDDSGIFLSRDGHTGLAQTRLSILDLSPAGHQPMASTDGRFQIVFNGEIYNFRELRRELMEQGETFRTETDTEVILRMYQLYGPECVREFAGMFAFVIWDTREETCFLARDPMGIKPLYYHQSQGGLVFASEIQALLRADLIPRRLSPNALQGYLLFGSVQEPETLMEGTVCLPAGHYLLWSKRKVRQRCYWEVQFHADKFDRNEAVAATRKGLMETVGRHFVSDVPVGIFLSGGIDSTTLVALARAAGREKLQTFCISFDDASYNEGESARRTAEHFGTEHHDWRLTAAMGRELVKNYLACQDQPSIDGFNTFCVSRHAHEHSMKVVLSGLGGDELFAGYRSFENVIALNRYGQLLRLAGPVTTWAGRMMERHARQPRGRRLGSYLTDQPSLAAAYWAMRGIFTPVESARLAQIYFGGDIDPNTCGSTIHFHVPMQPTSGDQVSYLEISRYMRNQLLRDSDVMSMASGLELRVPFVDSRLIETLSRIPAQFRLEQGKQLLVSAVPEIPEWVRSASKRGFTFPFEHWLAVGWEDLFERLDQASPVQLQSWYRRWSLLVLEHFLTTHKLETDRRLGASA